MLVYFFFFFQAEDGIRDVAVTGVQTCALPILKTPLTVLRAGVERAITTPNLPQETLATLEETLQEIKRMTELVDALLTLARADEGIAPLHREPVDLRGIVEEVRETGELLAGEPGGRGEGPTSELQSRLHLVCRLLL